MFNIAYKISLVNYDCFGSYKQLPKITVYKTILHPMDINKYIYSYTIKLWQHYIHIVYSVHINNSKLIWKKIDYIGAYEENT